MTGTFRFHSGQADGRSRGMSQQIDLIGVGSPVVDVLAHVEDTFLDQVNGDKGGMELVEDHELAGLVGKLEEIPTEAAGGSAGNTAFAAAKLGTRVAFLGKLGNCEAAAYYKKRFEEIGADVTRFKIGDVANARCLSLVTPDSQRTMRTSLGAAMTLTPEEIDASDFADVRHVHLEGYLAFNRDLKQRILESAKEAGCTISMDLASFEVVKASDGVLRNWLENYIDIVFANEDEASAFFPELGQDYEAMARHFADLCSIAAVKLGKDGSLIASEGEVHRVEPIVIPQAIDTTGAGDYWAGGFLHAWLQGKSLPECGRYGSILGAEVVQILGASLHDDRWEALNGELQ
ncbi:MAG: adenosine kinase [Verrucomicrobiota bacterium]